MTETNFFTDYQNLITSINNMTKDKEGYGYKYVELTPLLEEVLPKIHENNFILVQTVSQSTGDYHRRSESKDGILDVSTPAFVLHSELIHATDVKIESDCPLYVDDIDPQAFGSVETYMRRYSIYALLHIKTEDDDGVGASKRGKKNAPKLETFEDFVLEIDRVTNPKALGALWYQWREKFSQDSEEYKNLNKFSGNRKLLLQGENVSDVYYGCSMIVKNIVEGKNVV